MDVYVYSILINWIMVIFIMQIIGVIISVEILMF